MRQSLFRRAAAAALLLGIACSAAACDQKREGATRVAVIGDTPEIVDPASGPLAAADAALLSSVAQGLVRFDAQGQIVPGLAERWNVTDDGLSYIFRLASGEWPDGRKITAQQIARILRRQIASSSNNALKDSLGAVEEIVGMTDRVIEIRLTAPRPALLQLLAQPEFAIVREGQGSGPFAIAQGDPDRPGLRLVRGIAAPDGDEAQEEEIVLTAAEAPETVRSFIGGDVDLVLGGTFADLPYARAAEMPNGAVRFDPAAGLFGLVPAREGGPLADVELRRLLSQAIDRQALIDALDVPGLLPRATLLEPGLDGMADPVAPQWTAIPMAERRPLLAAAADRLFGDDDRPVVRIALPDGPGAQLLLNRLANDWGVLGIRVERSAPGQAADLRLIDAVAPSTSPAWYLRQFRCSEAAICAADADALLDAARTAPVAAQRAALLGQAALQMDEAQLFLPLAAPIRWSLVSDHVEGFAGNRFARHTLTALADKLTNNGSE